MTTKPSVILAGECGAIAGLVAGQILFHTQFGMGDNTIEVILCMVVGAWIGSASHQPEAVSGQQKLPRRSGILIGGGAFAGFVVARIGFNVDRMLLILCTLLGAWFGSAWHFDPSTESEAGRTVAWLPGHDLINRDVDRVIVTDIVWPYPVGYPKRFA